MPIIQRPYVPPEDKPPQEESYINPGDVASLNVNTATAAPAQAEGATSLEAITFYSDSFHVFSSLYSAVLFFGEQLEEREPILRARIKVSPQMMKAIAVLADQARPGVRGGGRAHHAAGSGFRGLGTEPRRIEQR